MTLLPDTTAAAVQSILRGHPAVADVAVLPGPEPLLVVVPVGFLNGPEVRAILRAGLPDAQVPARVAVVEKLPRLADGAVDRDRLDARLRGLPGGVYRFEPPADELERELAAVWLELLECAEVGATDDFIDVGGDSMTGVELVNLIDERFGIAIELDEVFQNTTVRGLAAAIRARGGVARAGVPATG